jgi:hypothetical protein
MLFGLKGLLQEEKPRRNPNQEEYPSNKTRKRERILAEKGIVVEQGRKMLVRMYQSSSECRPQDTANLPIVKSLLCVRYCRDIITYQTIGIMEKARG